ncbi:MAG: ribose-phosphate pyrophosphokinase-like domain-containing protein, partial [Candidatus Omnitrophica bacterium]|nr:ribose-phosphate pyrophosphokinase-like domain-containing protein [Candidatus Omnitrophota bacterium]
MKNNKEILVFSGNANRDLAKKICNYLKVQLGNAQVDRFNDGEIRIRIAEDVRGRDVFIV